MTLPTNKFTLIVSLPKNDLNMAKAALNGGADAIKVHLNVEHRASHTIFGNWQEERKNIENILNNVSITTGIMPGAEKVATENDIKEIEKSGIAFFDIYYKDAPTYLLKSKMQKMFALHYPLQLENLKYIDTLKWNFVEASIINPADYRKHLTLEDVNNYKIIVRKLKKPVIVPTQKKINSQEVSLLNKVGVKGIMIGAVVFGKDPKNIEKVCC